LLLLWYLSYIKGKRLFPAKIRPGDFQSLVIALPGLLGIGLGLSVLSSIVSGAEATGGTGAPEGVAAWVVMVFSCFSTGYLEETYFGTIFWAVSVNESPVYRPRNWMPWITGR
jgi:hypothetical protein